MTTMLRTYLPGEIRRRVFFAVAAIFSAIFVGAIGFHLIEGFALLDSFYLAAVTVTTVGYGDFTPKTQLGRIFAVFFVLSGVGTVLYSLTTLAQVVIQSEVFSALGNRRHTKAMEKLRDHFIICGAGRVGRRIINQLARQNVGHIAIERSETKVNELLDRRSLVIIGDATLEETLLKAGVERARGLAACLPDDADNLYVVLTARGMNPHLHIVARAVEEQAEPKLIRAGANRVISPTIIGSQSMARALVKPAIADFMDSIVAETHDLVFEEIAIERGSVYAGRQLKATNINSELDLIVIAIRRKTGEMIFQPSGETIVEEGDLLIVIGRAESMKDLLAESR